MAGSVVAAPPDIENQYDSLETKINEELDKIKMSPLSPLRCIYRVPHRLRCVREEDYTPRVISIGPLHHGKEALGAMEDHKKRYLRRFMSRNNLKLKDYIRMMKYQEPKLRSCYPQSIAPNSDDFVKIILVDAIFVIEVLLTHSNYVSPDDCIFGKPKMITDIVLDLLMLENQLPFFILKELFNPDIFTVPPESFHIPDHFVEKLSIQLLYHMDVVGGTAFGGMLPDDLLKKICSSREVQHFVDLFRKLWIAPLSNEPSMTKKKKSATAPSIEKLHLAGVKFKARLTTNLFDIRLEDGILKIPKVRTGDLTELLLRNLVAFEQCSATSDDYYISDYLKMMDELVDTAKDVELLVKYKIVENDLGGGDHDLSSLINRLSTGLLYDPDNFYYGDLSEKLDDYYRGKCHKWMANLRRNYFSTPWQTISFGAAFVLLILTAVQTICSILSLK